MINLVALRIPRRETALKLELAKRLKEEFSATTYRTSFVVFRHEDRRTYGIPDTSVTGLGKTTWWEVKHATPKIDGREIQNLTCRRLARAGYCRYIVFQELDADNKLTLIVHPDNTESMIAEAWTSGFDYNFIIDFIKRVHQ